MICNQVTRMLRSQLFTQGQCEDAQNHQTWLLNMRSPGAQNEPKVPFECVFYLI